MKLIAVFLFLLNSFFITISCNYPSKKVINPADINASDSSSRNGSTENNANNKPPLIYTLHVSAKKILSHLSFDQFDSLLPYIHPKKGMRIAPMVRIENYHPVFVRDSLKIKMAFDSIFWGYGDGSGLPIKMSWKNYKKQFITNRNYLSVDPIMSDVPIHSTLTKQNIQTFYPESYIEDFTINPKEDHDWGSVILVFENWNNNWYLTCVCSNYWTI